MCTALHVQHDTKRNGKIYALFENPTPALLLFLCRTENLIIQWASENVLNETWHVFNIYYLGIGAS